jgi:phthiocerol/phenolphthiocerol synthesis type-I polyketide synthase E
MSAREPAVESTLDIAIIGMSGRFPGAADVEAFWRNLCAGVESVQRLEREALLAAGVDASLLDSDRYVPARALLADIDQFDAAFFGYAPAEAASIDPQHRLFLECAWEAFEDAGRAPERAGVVGVYAGSSANGYLAQVLHNPGLVQSPAELALLLGSDKDFLTTRVSYKLDLTGPSVAVQTACSTSLVAVHLACQALLNGECDLALAGGASIGVPQQVGYLYQEDGIGSPDGHCRAFDASARGTVSGSGVGVVLLERLDDARRRGAAIIAVIKGSAINNDGRQKVGFTAPAALGQLRVIRAAHAAAGVDADTISYVEAHGTGTPLGDPIEVSALTEAFGGAGQTRAPCGLGSVKTNIGHLDAAAGVTGLIKVAQALRYRQLPPSLHFEAANPNIDFERSPFRVVRELTPWVSESPRRAAVSSFGLGGTNAHVVLEEAPAPISRSTEPHAELLVVSARSAAGLETLSQALAARLERDPELDLAAVAQTLQLGRRAFGHRRSAVVHGAAEAARWLRSQGAGHALATARPVVFLFPGQGVLRPGQCRELYGSVASFAADVDGAAELLRPRLGVDARELLFPHESARDAAERRLLETDLAQPLLFMLEYALARLWLSLGVEPVACLGHSLSEWVCACLGGSCSLPDALALMVTRGQLMQAAPAGGLLAVAASEAQLAPWLQAEVTLAATNAPRQCVLSGPAAALEAVASELVAVGIASRRLPATRAFHSPAMSHAAREFARHVARVRLVAPRQRWLSNVMGDWITDEQACSAEYWGSQLREPVRFAEGLDRVLRELGSPLLLEVGPGETLTQLCRQRLSSARNEPAAGSVETSAGAQPAALALASLPSQPGGDRAALLASVARIWTEGAALDFAPLWRERPPARAHLPTTPFERQSYWLQAAASPSADAARATSSGPDALATDGVAALADWFYVPSWQRRPLLEEASDAALSHWVLLAAPGPAPYERLLARIAAGLERTAKVTRCHAAVELAAVLAAADGDRIGARAFVAAQERGAFDVLGALQAIGASNRSARLLVLGTGLCDISGDEALRPEHAPLLGLCRSAGREYPRLSCRVLDLPGAALSTDAERLALQVLAEARSSESLADPLVAWRGQHRWIAGVTPLHLAPAPAACAPDAPDEGAAPRVRERGVYLILGGRGGVGQKLALWLARRGARLVLAGRSAEIDGATLQAIEAAGGEAIGVAADVTQADALRAAVELCERRFGVLHGVIHAASVAGGGLIQRLTPAGFLAELAPKAVAALLLEEVLGARRLDFVIHLSSLTALSGGVGQAGYAAANACLEALAHAAARRGGPATLAIDFDRWSGVGMAARSAERLRAMGLGGNWEGMSAEDGVEAFARIVTHALHLPQVLVSRRRLEALPGEDAFAESFAPHADGSRAPSDGRSARAEGRPSPAHVVERVGEIWARVLGVPSVDPEQSFFEQGGESLLALAILNRVREAFGSELSLRDFFATPTVHGVAAQVARLLPEPDAAPSAEREPALQSLPRSPRRYVPGNPSNRRPGGGDGK